MIAIMQSNYKVYSMKRKKLKQLLKYTGLWLIPPLWILNIFFIFKYKIYEKTDYLNTTILVGVLISLILMLVVYSKNHLHIINGASIDNIGWFDFLDNKPSRYDTTTGRKEAMKKLIDKDLLFEKPKGYCFGKDNISNKYVCMPNDINDSPGILITGGAGSGKSSTQIINYLLNNNIHQEVNALIIDVKGELADTTLSPSDDSTVIFAPTNRSSYGYDPFFELNDDSQEHEIYKTMDLISICLISRPNGDNAIWADMARQMFRGLLIYGYKYKKKRNIVDIISLCRSKPIADLIHEIYEQVPSSSLCGQDIGAFEGMAEETLYSVYMNMVNAISKITGDSDLAYALGTNPNKFNPSTLLDKSVDIQIPMHLIEAWGQVVFLILNQTELWIMSLPEFDNQRKKIAIVWDELTSTLSAIHNIGYTPQLLRLGRSKGCRFIGVVQSLDALYGTFNDDDMVEDFLSNQFAIVFLDAKTKRTQDYIIDNFGTYRKKEESWSGEGENRKKTISYKDENIIERSDLTNLAQSGDVIVISNRGNFKIRKVPWYKDNYYLQLYKQIHKGD